MTARRAMTASSNSCLVYKRMTLKLVARIVQRGMGVDRLKIWTLIVIVQLKS